MPATSFAEMPTLASSSSLSPPRPFHHRRKSWARQLERCCCTTFSYFPVAVVYGLTTWAIYVEVDVSFLGRTSWATYLRAGVGIALYTLANTSYTIAVFTSPGSPLDRQGGNVGRRKGGGYEGLPTYEDEGENGEAAAAVLSREEMTAVTAKSTGSPRFCKKCQCVKPDRAHHCSPCGRCVLKMDHHCPWLATCVGLRNYKAFLLFLVYLSLFCWACFAVTATWVWTELMDSAAMSEGFRVVNVILLSVLSGIIGLVLTGFTIWHLYLAATGQTTIESLEKTRYLSPLRKALEPNLNGVGAGRHYMDENTLHAHRDATADEDLPLAERVKQLHANALPGVLRPEEGDLPLRTSSISSPSTLNAAATSSPAHTSLHRSYASLEAQRERARYAQYLDEQDSEKMPNAFDLGWRRNLRQIFGPRALVWGLPVCNSLGDGWGWEVSPRWTEAQARVAREREQRVSTGGSGMDGAARGKASWKWSAGGGFVDSAGQQPPKGGSRGGSGRQSPVKRSEGSATQMQMQPLDRRKGREDGEDGGLAFEQDERQGETANWNDVPEDFLSPSRGLSRSRGRKKGD